MNLSQLDLLFKLNQLAYKRLHNFYEGNKGVMTLTSKAEVEEALRLLDLVVGEIDRLTLEE